MKNCKTGCSSKISHFFLLLLGLLCVLGACTFPVQPRYQPISESSARIVPRQGYQDYQIDEHTYLVTYENYFSVAPPEHGWLIDPFSEKWLKGAQEYVLYRAGELAKSKGAKYFAILHKDDWNQISFSFTRRRWGPHFSPGASVVMRILSRNVSSIPRDEGRIYEVDRLLDSLVQKNIGLSEYQRISLPQDGPVKNNDNRVIRWRSSLSGYDSVSAPIVRKSFWLGGFHSESFEPGAEITKKPSGAFEIAMWDRILVSPLQFLSQCVKLADQEGYEVFKLENWMVEEHRADGDRGDRRIWFKTRANVMLQHKKESESFEPVFVVEELRAHVDTKNIQDTR